LKSLVVRIRQRLSSRWSADAEMPRLDNQLQQQRQET